MKIKAYCNTIKNKIIVKLSIIISSHPYLSKFNKKHFSILHLFLPKRGRNSHTYSITIFFYIPYLCSLCNISIILFLFHADVLDSEELDDARNLLFMVGK